MAPPSPLTIATNAVNRLVKEGKQYREEREAQKAAITKLEEDIKNKSPDLDSNAGYILNQQHLALQQTHNAQAALEKQIKEYLQKLEEQIAIAESDGWGDDKERAREVGKAKEILISGRQQPA